MVKVVDRFAQRARRRDPEHQVAAAVRLHLVTALEVRREAGVSLTFRTSRESKGERKDHCQ